MLFLACCFGLDCGLFVLPLTDGIAPIPIVTFLSATFGDGLTLGIRKRLSLRVSTLSSRWVVLVVKQVADWDEGEEDCNFEESGVSETSFKRATDIFFALPVGRFIQSNDVLYSPFTFFRIDFENNLKNEYSSRKVKGSASCRNIYGAQIIITVSLWGTEKTLKSW